MSYRMVSRGKTILWIFIGWFQGVKPYYGFFIVKVWDIKETDIMSLHHI